jgi:hypothetical protein
MWPICRDKAVSMDDQGLLAMQKVEGSSPFSRFEEHPAAMALPCLPELVFVAAMCSYATDIARGLLPGPFDNADACRYARAFLIPEELLERPELDVDRAAAALGVPADRLRAARAEHDAMPRRRRRR